MFLDKWKLWNWLLEGLPTDNRKMLLKHKITPEGNNNEKVE